MCTRDYELRSLQSLDAHQIYFLDKISLLRRPCVPSAMYIPSPLESEVQRF